MKILNKIFVPVISVIALSAYAQEPMPKYLDDKAPIEQRVEDALSRMTLEEKLAMVHAQSKFSSAGVPSLGIPEIWTSDGPHGIRAEVLWDAWTQAYWSSDSCMAYPALTALAATWDTEMSGLYGKSIGEEARYRKKDVLLGPGVNIYRTPLNGRNFEYMGEDPFLAATIVVPYVQAVQKNGVAACVKHYALNNQEFNRHTTNVTLDDRALYELYLPAFKAAVQEGGAWAIMGSYNLYQNHHVCQNERLLQTILRDEWGFDGVVVSDWGAVHNSREVATNGLDMEFGSWTDGMSSGEKNQYHKYYMADPLYDLIKSGEVAESELDAKVRNVLRLAFRTVMDKNRPFGSFVSQAHREAGRKIAENGIVLLKNDKNLLPVQYTKDTKILVVGENAIKMMTVGGGSSSLKAKYEVSPLDGIKNLVGDDATVEYARGYIGEAKTIHHNAVIGKDISDNRSEEELFAEAVEMAKDADYVLYFGGLNKAKFQDSEGNDRKEYGLPYNQDKLIEALEAVNQNLVIVNISGNAVAMPWAKDVRAIVQGWYLGSEAGNALANVLFGKVNPSGKLPFSFPAELNHYGSHLLNTYPGTDHQDPSWTAKTDTVQVNYKESIFVGYRWLEKNKIKPVFSFGHGLSYTTFEYSSVELNKKTISKDGTITATLTITNSGSRDGSEVVQVYVSDLKSSLPRPVKELKAFGKINLKAGEAKTISFTLDKEAFHFYDDTKAQWVVENGAFEVLVGASSSDIRSKARFSVK